MDDVHLSYVPLRSIPIERAATLACTSELNPTCRTFRFAEYWTKFEVYMFEVCIQGDWVDGATFGVSGVCGTTRLWYLYWPRFPLFNSYNTGANLNPPFVLQGAYHNLDVYRSSFEPLRDYS
jgi:hypothetical protein